MATDKIKEMTLITCDIVMEDDTHKQIKFLNPKNVNINQTHMEYSAYDAQGNKRTELDSVYCGHFKADFAGMFVIDVASPQESLCSDEASQGGEAIFNFEEISW